MELKNIQDIFNNRSFRIPDYQRGYAWKRKQLDDIWQDINRLSDGKIHYTGLLSVDPQKGEDKTIHVVDGQQRLITLIILIHVICYCPQLRGKDWVNERDKKDYVKNYLHRKAGKNGKEVKMVFDYEKDNPSHVHFKNKILGLQTTEIGPEHTIYTKNLDAAKKFFEDKIGSLSFDQIELVLKKVTEQLQFLYYPLDSGLNKFVTFETLNYRGKDLTKLELLKNRLMHLSTELPDNDGGEKKALRTDINNVWKTVYEYLGKNTKEELSDDDFLKDHWIMYFDEYDRSISEAYAGFLLDKHFTLDNVANKAIKYDHVRDYVLDLQSVVQDWYYTHHPEESKYSGEVKIWLSKLKRIKEFGSFRPLMASILANKGKVGEEKIIATLKFAEQFNFVVLGLSLRNRNSNYKSSEIYQNTYKAHSSPEQFDPESINPSELGDAEDFTSEREKLNEKMREKWYYSNEIKYFLYEYEIYLQKKTRNQEVKLHWEQVNKDTIEHIYPQKPAPGCWPKFENEKAEDLLNELGNLMLFPRSKNAKVSNRSFLEKCEEYKIGSYSAIKVSNEKDWTAETIKARQKEMLDFLYERWDIEKLDRTKA